MKKKNFEKSIVISDYLHETSQVGTYHYLDFSSLNGISGLPHGNDSNIGMYCDTIIDICFWALVTCFMIVCRNGYRYLFLIFLLNANIVTASRKDTAICILQIYDFNETINISKISDCIEEYFYYIEIVLVIVTFYALLLILVGAIAKYFFNTNLMILNYSMYDSMLLIKNAFFLFLFFGIKTSASVYGFIAFKDGKQRRCFFVFLRKTLNLKNVHKNCDFAKHALFIFLSFENQKYEFFYPISEKMSLMF